MRSSRIREQPSLRRALLVGLCLALALGLITACSQDEKDDRAPAGLAKLVARADGPKRPVMDLWRSLQVRNSPVAAVQYHSRVLGLLGSRDIVGALDTLKDDLAVTSPKVIARDETKLGVLVIVNVESKGRAVGRQSFLVSKQGADWVILFDTLLADSIEGYVRNRVQQQLDPSAKKPSTRAIRAGAEALHRYRTLFLREPDQGSIESGNVAGESGSTPPAAEPVQPSDQTPTAP